METSKATKVAEVRPLPRTDNKNVKQIPRILSQHKVNSTTTKAAPVQQPMTINLNAGQVLLPIVGTTAPQTAQPIVLRCTIPQGSISTNTLTTSSSLTTSPNIIIQQLTAPSTGNVSTVPNLQILQPLLQNIIQQNQTSNIAKVIIMPSTTGKTSTHASTPTLTSLLNGCSTQSNQESPPQTILRIPSYENVLTKKANVPKTLPSCTVSKPPSVSNESNLMISNVFSLKDNQPDNIWSEPVISSDEEGDMDQVENIPVDDDLLRGDCHQVKAARRAAARIKKATIDFPMPEDAFCLSSEYGGEIPVALRLGDDVEVYETTPEVWTDEELGKYKPKANFTSKILFSPNTSSSNNTAIPNNVVNQTTKTTTKPPFPKMPRLVPKSKDTPIIISSPTASRNVDDYIVPLPKCSTIPKEIDDMVETIEIPTADEIVQEITVGTKRKGKVKAQQLKSGHTKRRKRKKASSGKHNQTSDSAKQPKVSQLPSSVASTLNSKPKKVKGSSTSSGYSTIRSLLNAPLGQMVTRRARAASQQAEVIEIDDKSEDSLGNPSSPSNPQGAEAAKKQLRMMLLTKSKDKQGDDNDCGLLNGEDEFNEQDNVPTEYNSDILPLLEHKDDGIVNTKNANSGETDDEFKSEDEMPDLVSEHLVRSANDIDQCKPEKKKPLKVKLCLKTTKRKGRKGKKTRKGKVESWNVATENAGVIAAEPSMEINEGLLELQQLPPCLETNHDEVATSGAEEEIVPPEKTVRDDAALEEKKLKGHKHKKKSKRKRKRKRDELEKEVQDAQTN